MVNNDKFNEVFNHYITWEVKTLADNKRLDRKALTQGKKKKKTLAAFCSFLTITGWDLIAEFLEFCYCSLCSPVKLMVLLLSVEMSVETFSNLQWMETTCCSCDDKLDVLQCPRVLVGCSFCWIWWKKLLQNWTLPCSKVEEKQLLNRLLVGFHLVRIWIDKFNINGIKEAGHMSINRDP